MLRLIYRLAQWCCVVLLSAIVLITVADVVLRKLFNSPIFGANEIITYLLAVTVGAGMAIASARNTHIKVDLLETTLRRLIGEKLTTFSQVIEALGTLLLATLLGVFAYDAWQFGDSSSVLKIPVGKVFILVSFSVFIAVIYIFSRSHGENEND